MKSDHAPVKDRQLRGAPVVDRVLDLALEALADHGYAGCGQGGTVTVHQ